MTGKIHSIETAGMVDGPGIRYVVFFAGCPLRCLYCHNPDTWDMGAGKSMSVDELMADIAKYRSYMQASGGGVTFTGGDPLAQPEFLLELLRACRERGIHTAVDTAGFVRDPQKSKVSEILAYADLLLLDIKSASADKFVEIAGVPQDSTLNLLKLSHQMQVPVWIRHVIVPGLTDGREELTALGELLQGYSNIERVDLLPFSKLGEYKWQAVSKEYTLTDVQPPTVEEMARARGIVNAKKH